MTIKKTLLTLLAATAIAVAAQAEPTLAEYRQLQWEAQQWARNYFEKVLLVRAREHRLANADGKEFMRQMMLDIEEAGLKAYPNHEAGFSYAFSLEAFAEIQKQIEESSE